MDKCVELKIGICSLDNHGENKDDLGGGSGFAVDTGRKRPVPVDQQNNNSNDQYQYVAAKNDDREAPGQLLIECQDEESRREQEVVGDGSELCAEYGRL